MTTALLFFTGAAGDAAGFVAAGAFAGSVLFAVVTAGLAVVAAAFVVVAAAPARLSFL